MQYASGQADDTSSSASAIPCHCFSLADIEVATNNFDDERVIGEGGFRKVYKGSISIEETNHVVAIKRLNSMSNQGAPEFKAEIEILSKLRHCHLVSLMGFCDDNKEMILVYEYMPHGTLHDQLHKAAIPFSWVQRLKIAIGAGRGLDYLHTGFGTQQGIIHRDVKSSNILLDENLAAKLSDFGLSKIGPTNQSLSCIEASVKGTLGYLDPEFFYTTQLTRKTDVYAFGVVLFELLSGRLPVDIKYGEQHCSLVRWAQKCVKEKNFGQMVDSNIRGTISPKCLRQFAKIADRCLFSIPKERPTMAEVVGLLQKLLELQKKWDISANQSGTMGFTSKIHKYLVSTTKQNSDQHGTSLPKSLKNNMNHGSSTNTNGYLKLFTYDELKLVTRDFENQAWLGEGSYGKAYKGWVDNMTYSPCKKDTGLVVPVRRFQRFSMMFDPETLKKFCHPNVVKILGYCLERHEIFLVYEFMHNSNFDIHLGSGAVARLPLASRVKIAVGVARGIFFLLMIDHEVSKSELDRNKIMLDEDFTAKLSDYDVTMLIHGRYTELYDPDYYAPGCKPLQLQSNLSGFRVLFAEIITGERIPNEKRKNEIENLVMQYGKKSLDDLADICFKICDEVDAESNMITILNEHYKLTRRRMSKWLPNSRNQHLRLIQMAMRDENHFFTRRITERGSDKIVFYSQDRMIQETDPKDVIWDEIIGEEEHPDNTDSYKFQETDSEFFIRDKNYGNEEYLENCSTPYQALPVFDEYEDKEWYVWFNGGVRKVQPKSYNSFVSRYEGYEFENFNHKVLLIWEYVIYHLRSMRFEFPIWKKIKACGWQFTSIAILNIKVGKLSLIVDFLALRICSNFNSRSSLIVILHGEVGSVFWDIDI